MKIKFSQLDLDISPDVAQEFIEYRQSMIKRYQLKTQRAFDRQMKEALKAPQVGMTPDQLIEWTIDQNWVGINVSYTKKRLKQMQEAESYGKNRRFAKQTAAEKAMRQSKKAFAIAERASNQVGFHNVDKNVTVVPIQMEITGR